MSKIQILSAELANKIAAGEVVERPASVVKELVDNAVDAGATEIDIEIRDAPGGASQGGTRLISVTDNGEGMDEEDLLKCVLRHGTSKIKDLEDLWRVRSMGFRGEALASIAAVSKVTIRSRQRGDVSGKEIRNLEVTGVKELKKLGVQEFRNLGNQALPVGMPEGTKVIVEDLFGKVPARRKFLKTAGTEFRKIVEVVNDFALAWPEVGFSLKHNGKEVLRYSLTPGVEAQKTPGVKLGRLRQVLGERFVDGLLPVRLDHPHLQISGWTGKPQLCHEVKYKQWLFVNQRRVRDMGLNKVIKQAYGTLLPARVYPVYVLYLDLPPEMVDVNVHPRKEEVKFVNSQMVYSSVIQAVKHGLEKGDLGFEYEKSEVRSQNTEVRRQKLEVKKLGEQVGVLQRMGVSYGQRKISWELNKPLQVSEDDVPYGTSQVDSGLGQVLQIHNLYLVTQSENGLMIVDQHAAHERVLYEKFVQEFSSKKNIKNRQELLVPLDLELMANEILFLEENWKVFEKLGFDVHIKNTNQISKMNALKRVSLAAVPIWATNKNLIQLIKEVIRDIEEDTLVGKIDDQSLRVLTYMACRSAVKAGDRLSEQEMRHILESLDLTQNNYTCPHGRPVKVEIGLRELERMFMRAGFREAVE